MFTYRVSVRAPELCKSRGGRPGLPVPNKPTVSVDVKKKNFNQLQPRVSVTAQELCESRGGRPGLPVPNSPYGLCGHRATPNLSSRVSAPVWGDLAPDDRF